MSETPEQPVGEAYPGETDDAAATRDDLAELDRQARIDEGDVAPDEPTDDELSADPQEEPGAAFAPGEGQAEADLAADEPEDSHRSKREST